MKNRPNQFREYFGTAQMQNNSFAPVYYYLFAGIILLVAVFLFLPRVAIG